MKHPEGQKYPLEGKAKRLLRKHSRIITYHMSGPHKLNRYKVNTNTEWKRKINLIDLSRNDLFTGINNLSWFLYLPLNVPRVYYFLEVGVSLHNFFHY